MGEITAPPIPSGLTQRERLILGRFITRMRHIEQPSRMRVWDECRAAVGVLVDLNVFYVVTIDAQRRTRTIDYIRHRSGVPEVGMVGDPYGPMGLCPRLLANPKPYVFAEDDGACFLAGYPYRDEFDAKDVVAVQIPRPDGSLYGAIVASSLSAQQFSPAIIDCIRWIGEVGYLFRHRSMDAVLDAVWYPEIVEGDITTWSHHVLYDAVEVASRARISLSEGDVQAASQALDELVRELYTAQVQLSQLHPQQSKQVEKLKPRERDVLRVLATDSSVKNGEIAERLGMSVGNVKKLLSGAMAKTGAKNRHDLHRLAVLWRL